MALKIYIKARATPKVVAAFAERREFDKILIYSKQVQSLVLRNSHFQLLGRSCSLKCTGSLKPFDFFFRLDTHQTISFSSKQSYVLIHR
jgi:hypothetical protein